MNRRAVEIGATVLRAIGYLCLGWAVATVLRRFPVWKIRFHSARLARRLPDRLLVRPLRVLPPPDHEYVGVWDVDPAVARERLLEEHECTQLVRAYLHAYERDGQTIYEVASCVHRPEGIIGRWQLHVRLFPRPDGRTDVWCHRERNPNVSPIAHLRMDGYDPGAGVRWFNETVSRAVAPAPTDEGASPARTDRAISPPAADETVT